MKDTLADFSSLLGMDLEKLIPILVSISIFALGIIITQIIALITAYKRRTTHRRLCKLNHALLIDEVKQHGSYFRTNIKALVIENKGHFDVQYGIFASLPVFKELGYENVYKAYLNGVENHLFVNRSKRIKAFNLLWKCIEIINDTYPKSITIFDKTLERHNKVNENRNVHLRNATDNIEAFRIHFHRQLSIKEPLGAFYHKRELIREEFVNLGALDPKQSNEYFTKVLNLNNDNFELLIRYERDINAVKLNSYIADSQLEYHNMENNLKSASHYYKELERKYHQVYNDLIYVLNVLNQSY